MMQTEGAGGGRCATAARGRRPNRVLAGLFALSLAAAAPLAAQERPERVPLERAGPTSLGSVEAFVGWLAPVGSLTRDPDSFATSINPSVSFGARGDLWFGGGRFGIGVQGMWMRSELDVTATEFEGAIPTDLGNVDYVTAAAALQYRLGVGGPASTVQPYFLLGGGIRYLNVEEIAAPEVEDSTDPMGVLGGGVEVPISSTVIVDVGLRDFISFYKSPSTGDSRVQNDISITVALGVRFF